MNISISDCTVEFNEVFSLQTVDWQLKSGEHWAIVGPNGGGKSALAAVLMGEGQIREGEISGIPDNVQLVSVESQRELIERERKRDDSDLTDEVFEGTSVREILLELSVDETVLWSLVGRFELEAFLNRAFRTLSTGETRKVLIMRALASNPDILILDGPFDGLDADSTALLFEVLRTTAEHTPTVTVLNRFDEIPEFVTHLVYMDEGRIDYIVDYDDKQTVADLEQLLHLKTSNLTIPPTDLAERIPALNPDDPMVRMKKAKVAYGDNVIFSNLDWSVQQGEHWQITGPNGSGKTCLLNLITGDHPQCYINDIFVFGYQRGQGESIWEIKQHIGYVSTALQWEYRVSINLLNVIISGFYDSIGLYQKATDNQKDIAQRWLELLGMRGRQNQPFNQLSYGDQRLLLIARAMVKHPHLLILDEPCLGLDDINRNLVLALIEKICAGSETTVVYVNHHAEDRIAGIEKYLSLQ